MRDAFGVERGEISKAMALPAPIATKVGNGLRLLKRKPAVTPVTRPASAPVGNFVHADEGAIKAFTAQKQRYATRRSFG